MVLPMFSQKPNLLYFSKKRDLPQQLVETHFFQKINDSFHIMIWIITPKVDKNWHGMAYVENL